MRTLTIVMAAVIIFLIVGELIIYTRLLCIEEELKLLKEGCGRRHASLLQKLGHLKLHRERNRATNTMDHTPLNGNTA